MQHLQATNTSRRRRMVCLLSALALTLVSAQASTVRRLNLEELVEKAGRIVVGRCERVEVEPHPSRGLTTTVFTLEVHRVLKGAHGFRESEGPAGEHRETLTFRMPGGGVGDGTAISGLPRFRAGEELILFLYPESRSGMTSPVGLGQGAFRIAKDKGGRRIATNGAGNRALLDRLSPAAAQRLRRTSRDAAVPSPLSSQRLIQMIEELRP